MDDEGVSGQVTEALPLGRDLNRHEGDQVGNQPVHEPQGRPYGRGLEPWHLARAFPNDLDPGQHLRVSDTMGAGDAFNGGLAYTLSEGAEWPQALQFATRLASTVVSRTSEERYPTLEEIMPMN